MQLTLALLLFTGAVFSMPPEPRNSGVAHGDSRYILPQSKLSDVEVDLSRDVEVDLSREWSFDGEDLERTRRLRGAQVRKNAKDLGSVGESMESHVLEECGSYLLRPGMTYHILHKWFSSHEVSPEDCHYQLSTEEGCLIHLSCDYINVPKSDEPVKGYSYSCLNVNSEQHCPIEAYTEVTAEKLDIQMHSQPSLESAEFDCQAVVLKDSGHEARSLPRARSEKRRLGTLQSFGSGLRVRGNGRPGFSERAGLFDSSGSNSWSAEEYGPLFRSDKDDESLSMTDESDSASQSEEIVSNGLDGENELREIERDRISLNDCGTYYLDSAHEYAFSYSMYVSPDDCKYQLRTHEGNSIGLTCGYYIEVSEECTTNYLEINYEHSGNISDYVKVCAMYGDLQVEKPQINIHSRYDERLYDAMYECRAEVSQQQEEGIAVCNGETPVLLNSGIEYFLDSYAVEKHCILQPREENAEVQITCKIDHSSTPSVAKVVVNGWEIVESDNTFSEKAANISISNLDHDHTFYPYALTYSCVATVWPNDNK